MSLDLPKGAVQVSELPELLKRAKTEDVCVYTVTAGSTAFHQTVAKRFLDKNSRIENDKLYHSTKHFRSSLNFLPLSIFEPSEDYFLLIFTNYWDVHAYMVKDNIKLQVVDH